MRGKSIVAWGAFLCSLISLIMLVIVLVVFWKPISEDRVKKFKVAGIEIEIDTAKIEEAGKQIPTIQEGGRDIVIPLEELGANGRLFIMARERGEFDTICTDPESTDPNATPERIIEVRKEASAWKKLELLKLADARPAKKPYSWCKAGATQTFALT